MVQESPYKRAKRLRDGNSALSNTVEIPHQPRVGQNPETSLMPRGAHALDTALGCPTAITITQWRNMVIFPPQMAQTDMKGQGQPELSLVDDANAETHPHLRAVQFLHRTMTGRVRTNIVIHTKNMGAVPHQLNLTVYGRTANKNASTGEPGKTITKTKRAIIVQINASLPGKTI